MFEQADQMEEKNKTLQVKLEQLEIKTKILREFLLRQARWKRFLTEFWIFIEDVLLFGANINK